MNTLVASKNNYFETGYIYTPYVPMYITSAIEIEEKDIFDISNYAFKTHDYSHLFYQQSLI